MIVERCPRCNSPRDTTERFCWWCSEDLMKHDTTCHECGQTKGLARRVWKYVKEEIACW